MKRILSIFLGVSTSLLVPVAAFAAVVTVTENTTITLPSDGSSYTLKNASTFNSLSASGGTFTFTLDPKDQVIIISAGKKNLANSRSIDTICNADDSQLVQSVATTGAQVIVTITPSGTCGVSTVVATDGGSGGGGGGSSSSSSPAPSASPTPTPSATSTPSPTPSPLSQPHALMTSPPVISLIPPPSPTLISVSPVIISRTLVAGSRGDDVKILQTFFASDASIYPEGVVSGFFGPKTKAAVQRFQEKYGIANKGQSGYGILGPKTKAKIKELSGRSVTSSSSSPVTSSSSSRIADLQKQLKMLQDMLKKLQQK